MQNIDLSLVKDTAELPPVHLWKPDFCGQMDLTIKANGEWWHEGAMIKRPKMVKMFSRILWHEEGQHFLVTPVEKIQIQVEDAAFLVQQCSVVQVDGQQQIRFITTVDDELLLGRDCDFWMANYAQQQRPYIDMRYGMKALLQRNVFYELVALAVECEIDGQSHMCIHSMGKCFSLGVC